MKPILLAIVIVALIGAGTLGFFFASLPNNLNVTQNGTTSSINTAITSTADWSKYLGYIPQGYKLAPHLPNAPIWPCPKGMSDEQCKVFQASCGNGVCDPNERCDTCPIDCGVTGALRCDPYTGRAGAPASVCQVQAQQQAQQG